MWGWPHWWAQDILDQHQAHYPSQSLSVLLTLASHFILKKTSMTFFCFDKKSRITFFDQLYSFWVKGKRTWNSWLKCMTSPHCDPTRITVYISTAAHNQVIAAHNPDSAHLCSICKMRLNRTLMERSIKWSFCLGLPSSSSSLTEIKQKPANSVGIKKRQQNKAR